MRLSEVWLKKYLDSTLTSEVLMEKLTMAGIEVESIEPIAPVFNEVVVGVVTRTDPHPNADRLKCCQVDIGSTTLSIVCGAANVASGQKVACAVVGATLPGMHIKATTIRGVQSQGMLCSESELGLASSSEGIMVLAADAPIGKNVREFLQLDDRIIHLKITPNRGDCLSILGISREASVLTNTQGSWKSIATPSKIPHHFTEKPKIHIPEDVQSAVPRYCARIIRGIQRDVKTPQWVVHRLQCSGIRSIHPVVDLTNFVMLEMGQPLHAFDAAKIHGDIQLRFAKPNESITLLHGETATLHTQNLVIADAQKAVALAGIMGGVHSAVSADTQDLILESAFFTPQQLIGKARQLGIATDSSERFERGVDFELPRPALERLTSLILEICGGSCGPIVEITAPDHLPRRKPIKLRQSRAERILGIDMPHQTIRKLLTQSHLKFLVNGMDFEVTSPPYRFDLAQEIDFIEELIRVQGYETLPPIPPRKLIEISQGMDTSRSELHIKQQLTQMGYHETLHYSFSDAHQEKNWLQNAAPILLANPIAEQFTAMRSSLIPGLLNSLQFNLDHQQSRIKLFEIGTCFFPSPTGFSETQKLAMLCYGSQKPLQWGAADQSVDFYDFKGELESLFAQHDLLLVNEDIPNWLHPGRSAQILHEGEAHGFIGQLHPSLSQQLHITECIWVLECSLAPLQKLSRINPQVPGKFLPVNRDVAVKIATEISFRDLEKSWQEAHIPFLQKVEIFDLYVGEKIGSGLKSLALRLTLLDTDKTLKSDEIDQSVQAFIAVLQGKFNAELRT